MSSYSYPPPPGPGPVPGSPVPHTPWGPFSAGELVRRTFALYREHAPAVISLGAVTAGIMTVAQLPFLAINMLLIGKGRDPSHILTVMPVLAGDFFVVFLMTLAVYALAGGSFFVAVLLWRQGLAVTVSEALTAAGKRFPAAFGTILVVFLRLIGWYVVCIVIAVVVGGVIGGIAAASGNGAGKSIGFALAFIVGALIAFSFMIWQQMRYSVAIGAVYAENTGALESIRRSIQLTRHNKGRIGALLAVLIGVSLASLVVILPIMLGPALIQAMHGHGFGSQLGSPMGVRSLPMSLLQLAVSYAFTALVMFPIGGIGLSLCYLDLRARTDGQLQAVPAFEPVPDFPEAAVATRAWDDPPPRAPYIDQPRAFRSDPGRGALTPAPVPTVPDPPAPDVVDGDPAPAGETPPEDRPAGPESPDSGKQGEAG